MTKGRKPTDEELKLWQHVTQGVRPLASIDMVIHKVLPPSKISVRKKIEERQYKELYILLQFFSYNQTSIKKRLLKRCSTFLKP